MKKLVECVPNFSEGRNKKVIARIAATIEQGPVELLGVESDKDYNRTVITFAGEPGEVKAAAFEAIKMATQLIDMSEHSGQHPRIGATDVCPFVPITASMEDCIWLANELGKKVGEELKIPVYLYGESAILLERRELSFIRKGEYEGLKAKLKRHEWKPDYGPAKFNAKTGALVIGARHFLIAFNINLSTNDISIAHQIARRVRESGRIVGGKRVTGSLKYVKAMGVLLEDHDLAQVSMNLTNYKVTGLHKAFDEISKEAKSLDCEVTGSQIVGLVPEEALVEAGRHSARKRGVVTDDKARLIEEAINRLGLSQLGKFEPKRRVVEYLLEA